MRLVKRNSRQRGSRRRAGAGLLLAGAAVGGIATRLDKRRLHMARDRAAALGRRAAALADRKMRYASGHLEGAVHQMRPADGEREYDDTTLARKVETEIFRPADAPKATVSVNAQDGIVELRGEVKRPEQVRELAAAAGRVDGVRDVHNLLHTPGSPPKHSPPSDPEDVRRRAEEPTPPSRFARNPATRPPEDEPLVERADDARTAG